MKRSDHTRIGLRQGKDDIMENRILGAAIGTCVHVAGLHHFLKLAEAEGFETISLGPAVSVERLVQAILREHPTITAVSYRLTPQVAATLFESLRAELSAHGLHDIRLVFGGTSPVCEVAKASGLFESIFSGQESVELVQAYLRGGPGHAIEENVAHDLLSRIHQKYPYPILRHHFGLPSLEETILGAKLIAEAGVLDVISLGPDQNAQEHFFHPDEMDHSQDGAGGVPVRTVADLRAIYQSSRCGNYPLMRCYSGTRDLIRWAEMSVDAIHNAWAAIPLCWYSVMDGRSKLPLFEAIREKQQAMRWYADRGLPVEVNEAHQWSLRDAHDSLAVAMAFLAAYNAKQAGVKSYVAQFMFNTPPVTWPTMDIAKMLAKNELIGSLHDESFASWREVRAGIAHFAADPSTAQGQLAASAVISLSLRPHILHVVGFSEGHHATTAQELIQSCRIVHGVLHNCLHGLPDMTGDPKVVDRKDELIREARVLLHGLKAYGEAVSDDPLNDAWVLSHAIQQGLLDTPHFRGNPALCGKITTRCIDGAWYAVDEDSGESLTEQERLAKVMSATPALSRPRHEESK
jgi:methylmalonyl-CoA mutase cobalamin-binding subunit